MEKIYSLKEPNTLLHIIHRVDDFCSERNDIVPADQFIQLATLKLGEGKSFKAHKHISKAPWPYSRRAQESWVVIKGKVKCVLYDLDDTIIAEPILEPGDCSVTLRGGHNYIALVPSLVLEYKTGPYEGQEKDKVFMI